MTSHILWKIKNAPNHQPDHQLWIVRIGRISDCHVFYYAEGHQARVLSATGHFGHGRLPHREAKEEGPNRFLGDVDPWWWCSEWYLYKYNIYHYLSIYIYIYNVETLD